MPIGPDIFRPVHRQGDEPQEIIVQVQQPRPPSHAFGIGFAVGMASELIKHMPDPRIPTPQYYRPLCPCGWDDCKHPPQPLRQMPVKVSHKHWWLVVIEVVIDLVGAVLGAIFPAACGLFLNAVLGVDYMVQWLVGAWFAFFGYAIFRSVQDAIRVSKILNRMR